MKKTISTFFLLLGVATGGAQSLSGFDVAEKVHNRLDGDSRYCEMKLTLINKNGSKRVRELKSYSKDYGQDRKTIMFFMYPGDVKGTGFLTWDYDQTNKDDDKWLYLPAMKKSRRISGSSSKTDYFMGTDFTYDDMGRRNLDEDTHTLLREEPLDGHKCWVLQSIPKKAGDIYAKRISWIRQDCLIPVKVEFYDKLGKLHRQLIADDIKKIDGYWTIGHMNMKNVQTKHETDLLFNGYKYDKPTSDHIFTILQLEKGL
ncbi:MAG: outer membrane lipoprotein-sorting protein [Paludibacteraceae bacterium]|nr:outer membrane lipoprotein-sorting protein [Paludibacteraceae bacterium]